MKNVHTRFPTYKTKKHTACNDFQSQYRNEIKELISGTEYLDQFISKYKNPVNESRNENNSRNFNCMTPEAKRKLMFQKPVTLVKRQNKYYCNHAKTPTKSAKQEENQRDIYCSEKNIFNSPKFSPKYKIEQIKANQAEEDLSDQNEQDDIPRFSSIFKSPAKSNHFQTPQKQNFSSQKVNCQQNQISNKELFDQEEYDSYSFESDEVIEKSHYQIKNNIVNQENEHNDSKNDQLPPKENKNKGFNYFQISFGQEELNEDEFSDSHFEKDNNFISDNNSTSEAEPIKNEQKLSLSQNKKAIIMVSSDAIEAEVNYTSDSSSDFEFQSQFFVQEKVIKPNCAKNINNCGNFISSEAIESFSDE